MCKECADDYSGFLQSQKNLNAKPAKRANFLCSFRAFRPIRAIRVRDRLQALSLVKTLRRPRSPKNGDWRNWGIFLYALSVSQ